MAKRLAPFATILALAFGAIPAWAQVQRPDAMTYPSEADTLAAKPAIKPDAKAKARSKNAKQAAPAAGAKTISAKSTDKTSDKATEKAGVSPAAKTPEKTAALPREKPAATKAAPEKSGPDAFAGIPHDERMQIQAALLWSGDYTGAANGDDPMLAAIRNFQKRIKAKVTGQLTGEERARLKAAARDREQEFGWNVVADPATGIRIGLPTKMVPHAREAARGTLWSSRHGEMQVETFRVAEGVKLSELFEKERKQPATRKVEHSVLRDDSFFISGLQGLKRFSVRATMRNGEVRGFTMMFDQAMEGIVAPVMVAMASAFSPFPQRSAPFATLSKSVEYGNGLVVSVQGHIVTDARLAHGCQVLVAAGLGDADRIADDKENGLALLRVYGPRKMMPLSLTRDAAKSGEKRGELTLIGIPDPKEHGAGHKLTEIKARLMDGNSIELHEPVPMAGFSGAAALNAQGRFIGMTEMRNAVLASAQATAPPVRLVRAETIHAFLHTQKVPTAPAQTGDAKDSVVRIICVRK